MKAFQIQNLLRVGTVAAALALGGVAAHAAGPDGHGGRHHGAVMTAGGLFGARMDRLLDFVDATDAQRSQIDTIFKTARQDLAGQRDAGRTLHQQLATLYTAPNIDAAAIEAVRAQISSQREAAAKRMSQASIEAARVLTPEQRSKAGEAVKKRLARHAARHNS